jgi:hypothetical protein
MPTVYVLACRKGKYYVGKTNRPIASRVFEHMLQEGSEWTAQYPPLRVIEVKHDADDFDEDKFTKIYMKKYGIDNVRGGSYTQLTLSDDTKQHLMKELCSAEDLCFRCNRPGHFANTCYARTKVDGSLISDDAPDDASDAPDDSDAPEYASHITYDVSYEISENKEYYHTKKTVYQNQGHQGHQGHQASQAPKCYRCGRFGHYASSCYASTHMKGYRL